VLQLFSKEKGWIREQDSWFDQRVAKWQNVCRVFIRLDDAGENYALEKACNQHNLKIKFEYSGPRTPQTNGKIERKFQTLYGRIREMMNDSGIEGDFRNGL
jgi:transposase InsO family protein